MGRRRSPAATATGDVRTEPASDAREALNRLDRRKCAAARGFGRGARAARRGRGKCRPRPAHRACSIRASSTSSSSGCSARPRAIGTPAALLSVDVEDLKAINDRHGRIAGDAALRHVARLLRSLIRSSDVAGAQRRRRFLAAARSSRRRFRRSIRPIGSRVASPPIRSISAMRELRSKRRSASRRSCRATPSRKCSAAPPATASASRNSDGSNKPSPLATAAVSACHAEPSCSEVPAFAGMTYRSLR